MRTAAEGRGPLRARVTVAPGATATSLGVTDRNDPSQDSPFGFFCIKVPLTARAGELGCGSCGGESDRTSGGGCASGGFPGGGSSGFSGSGSTEYSESTSDGPSRGTSSGYLEIGSESGCGTLGCSGLGNSGSPGYSGEALGGYSGYSSSGYSPSGSNGHSEVGYSGGGLGGYSGVVSTGYSAGGSGAYVGAGSNGYSAGEPNGFSNSGSGAYPEVGPVGYTRGGVGSGTWIGTSSAGNIQRRPNISGFGSGSSTWTSTSFSSGNLANRPGTGRLIGCLTNKPGECGGATVAFQNGGNEDYGSDTYSTVSPVSSRPEEMQIYQIDIRSNVPPRK